LFFRPIDSSRPKRSRSSCRSSRCLRKTRLSPRRSSRAASLLAHGCRPGLPCSISGARLGSHSVCHNISIGRVRPEDLDFQLISGLSDHLLGPVRSSIEIWLAEVARVSRPPVVPRGNGFPHASAAHKRWRGLSFSNHSNFVFNDQIVMSI
jgi:hypothetical protein